MCIWKEHYFERVTSKIARSVDQAFDIMFQLKAEEEGVILKLKNSIYEPGGDFPHKCRQELTDWAFHLVFRILAVTVEER